MTTRRPNEEYDSFLKEQTQEDVPTEKKIENVLLMTSLVRDAATVERVTLAILHGTEVPMYANADADIFTDRLVARIKDVFEAMDRVIEDRHVERTKQVGERMSEHRLMNFTLGGKLRGSA